MSLIKITLRIERHLNYLNSKLTKYPTISFLVAQLGYMVGKWRLALFLNSLHETQKEQKTYFSAFGVKKITNPC